MVFLMLLSSVGLRGSLVRRLLPSPAEWRHRGGFFIWNKWKVGVTSMSQGLPVFGSAILHGNIIWWASDLWVEAEELDSQSSTPRAPCSRRAIESAFLWAATNFSCLKILPQDPLFRHWYTRCAFHRIMKEIDTKIFIESRIIHIFGFAANRFFQLYYCLAHKPCHYYY